MKKKLIMKPRAQDQDENGSKRASRTGLMNWDDFLDSQSVTSIIAGEPTPEFNSKYQQCSAKSTQGKQYLTEIS